MSHRLVLHSFFTEGDQSNRNGVPDKTGAAAQIQLLVDAGSIGLDRLATETEVLGDLRSGVALDHPSQDLKLPRAQTLLAFSVSRRLSTFESNLINQRRINKLATSRGRADR